MIYKISIKKKAKKFIDKQPPFQRKRIYEAISKLPSGDIKGLIRVDNRGDIYKKLSNYI